ncbi:MAG: hypothetical protein [Circoviridae sp.]|nr:MAG: hypothetical protein [Circoviridae sp.]
MERRELGSLAIAVKTIQELTGNLRTYGGITITVKTSSWTSSMDGSLTPSSFDCSIEIPFSSKEKVDPSSSRAGGYSAPLIRTPKLGTQTKTIPPFVVASKMLSTSTSKETPIQSVDLSNSPSMEQSPPPMKRAKAFSEHLLCHENLQESIPELTLLDPLPPFRGPPLFPMLNQSTLGQGQGSSLEIPTSQISESHSSLNPPLYPDLPSPTPMITKGESYSYQNSCEDFCPECFCLYHECVCNGLEDDEMCFSDSE